MWWLIATLLFAASALLFARENRRLRWRLNDMAVRNALGNGDDPPNLCRWCQNDTSTCRHPAPVFGCDVGLALNDDRVVQCQGYRFCGGRTSRKEEA